MRLGALSVVAAAAAGLVVALGGGSDHAALARGSCGTERWPIKTLTDAHSEDVDFHPRLVAVNHLRNLDRPEVHESSPRIAPHELRTYKVRANVITAKLEDDSDFHLVIVEFPAHKCTQGAVHRAAMTRARRNFIQACGQPSSSSFTDLIGHGRIAGVGFWDFLHGQTGVAPNGFELHPVLSFKSTSCKQA